MSVRHAVDIDDYVNISICHDMSWLVNKLRYCDWLKVFTLHLSWLNRQASMCYWKFTHHSDLIVHIFLIIFSYLFYSDWGHEPRIVRTSMNGQEMKVIVQKKIVQPNGIALDYVKKQLYWSDAYLDYIERVDYNGDYRTIIAQGKLVRMTSC